MGDLNEAVKKLRRLILVDGIPSATVSLISCSPKVPSPIARVGSLSQAQGMEDTLGRDGTAGKHLPRIRVKRTLRGQGEDQE